MCEEHKIMEERGPVNPEELEKATVSELKRMSEDNMVTFVMNIRREAISILEDRHKEVSERQDQLETQLKRLHNIDEKSDFNPRVTG